MSVGFTDQRPKDEDEIDYVCEESVLGHVFYPRKQVSVDGPIQISYMDYPWYSCFEVKGLSLPK